MLLVVDDDVDVLGSAVAEILVFRLEKVGAVVVVIFAVLLDDDPDSLDLDS